jgi:hypothetical protein
VSARRVRGASAALIAVSLAVGCSDSGAPAGAGGGAAGATEATTSPASGPASSTTSTTTTSNSATSSSGGSTASTGGGSATGGSGAATGGATASSGSGGATASSGSGGASATTSSAGTSAGGAGGAAPTSSAGTSTGGAGGAAPTTRLKAKFIAGSDGSKMYLDGVLYDSLLGLDCWYRLAADGQMRCLPVDAVDGAQVIYRDATCAQGVVWVIPPPPGCPFTPPKYAAVGQLPGVCNSAATVHIFEMGAMTTRPSPQYYLSADGVTCGCCEGTAQPTDAFYVLGPELPAASFVAASDATDD